MNTHDAAGTPIRQLHLSRRAYNCLRKAGISTVSDLVTRSERDLMKLWGFGETCLNDVNGKLDKRGLALRGNIAREDAEDNLSNPPAHDPDCAICKAIESGDSRLCALELMSASHRNDIGDIDAIMKNSNPIALISGFVGVAGDAIYELSKLRQVSFEQQLVDLVEYSSSDHS